MTPARLALCGAALFVIGVLWGVIMVGVPYQDPTPAQRAHERLHSSVTGWLMGVGALVLILGIVVAALQRFARRRTPRP